MPNVRRYQGLAFPEDVLQCKKVRERRSRQTCDVTLQNTHPSLPQLDIRCSCTLKLSGTRGGVTDLFHYIPLPVTYYCCSAVLG